MRNLLIPTDLSENAMNAICYALGTYKYEFNEFFIKHVYEDEVYETKTQMSRSSFEDSKKTIHNKSLESLKKIGLQINNPLLIFQNLPQQ